MFPSRFLGDQPATIDTDLPEHRVAPAGMPPVAFYKCGANSVASAAIVPVCDYFPVVSLAFWRLSWRLRLLMVVLRLRLRRRRSL